MLLMTDCWSLFMVSRVCFNSLQSCRRNLIYQSTSFKLSIFQHIFSTLNFLD
uniref:Uncharacterized protein n=1 Tax=Rhizophora mucronata TaxID=61149 RepID=A0A2P2QQL2_RHIMU